MKRALKVSDLIQIEEKQSKGIELIDCQQHMTDGRMLEVGQSNDNYAVIIYLGFNEYFNKDIFSCYRTKDLENPTIWFGHLNDGTY